MIDIQIFERGGETMMFVNLSGRLTQMEYAVFLPHFESEVRHHKGLRLMFDLNAQLSWEPRSCWRRLKFDSRQQTHISKLAVLGGGLDWYRWLSRACQPLTIERRLAFPSAWREQAIDWLSS